MDTGSAVMAAIVIVIPFLVLAMAALWFGVDSRPGVGERDRRPWMVG